MTKQESHYLSSCCRSDIIYGTELDEELEGVFGVCESCHDYVRFYDEDHIPDIHKPLVKPHDCELVSMCCGAYPSLEVDTYLTGFCGRCHDATGFECAVDENCENNTYALLDKGRV